MSVDLFKWVTDTFTKPKMQTTPHVMEAGAQVLDPEVEAAKRTLAVPQMADPQGNPPGTRYVHGRPVDGPVKYDSLIDMFTPSQHKLKTTGSAEEVFPNPAVPPVTAYNGGMAPEYSGQEMTEQETLDYWANARRNPDSLPQEVEIPPLDPNLDPLVQGVPNPVVDQANLDPNSLLPPPLPEPDKGYIDDIYMPNEAEARAAADADLAARQAVTPGASKAVQEEPEDALPGMTDAVNDDDEDLKPEEAAAIVKGIEDNGPVNGVTPEQAKEVAASDPKGFKKALNWFTDTMGLQNKDLYRMAMFYAGSRLAGYDHSGSMTWAFETGMTMATGREAIVHSLSESGRFDQASIEKFKKTGDRSDLKLTKDPDANAIKTDFTAPKLGKDGKKFFLRTDKTGNKWYESTDGTRSDGAGLKDPTDPQSRVEIINDQTEAATGLISGVADAGGITRKKDGVQVNGNWRVVPEEAGPNAVETIIDMLPNINTSDELSNSMVRGVIKRATEMAMRDAERGIEVTEIQPYVISQMQYFTDDGSDNGWKQALMRNGEKLKVEEWFMVREDVLRGIEGTPEWNAAVERGGEKGATNAVFDLLYKQYLEDTPAEKRKDGNAFFGWLQNNFIQD